MELSEAARDLYALPPRDFVAQRNRRAKDAKTSDRSLSDAISRLRKPTSAAWAVDLLARDGDRLGALAELGDRFRDALSAGDGRQLRELGEERRRLVAQLTARAADLASSGGEDLSDSARQDVEHTLMAAIADLAAFDAVRSGLLVHPLSATGVDPVDLEDAVAAPFEAEARPKTTSRAKSTTKPEPSAKPKPEPSAAERRMAQRAEANARSRLEETEKQEEKAQAEREEAAAEAEGVTASMDRLTEEAEALRARLRDLEAELRGLERERGRAERRREQAEESAERARAAAGRARDRLDELRGGPR